MKKRGYLLALVLGTCSLAFLSSLILARVVSADRLFVVRTQNRLKTDLRALEQVQLQLEERVQQGALVSEAAYIEFDGQSEIDGSRCRGKCPHRRFFTARPGSRLRRR